MKICCDDTLILEQDDGILTLKQDNDILTINQDKFDLYTKYPCFIGNKTVIEENTENNKEENNMSNTILDLWKEKILDELENKFNKQKQKVEEKDPLYKATVQYVEEAKELSKSEAFNSVLDNLMLEAACCLAPESTKEINDISIVRDNMKDKVSIIAREIEVQLNMTETYEQKINILKAYKILDEEGKINIDNNKDLLGLK